MEIKIRFNMKGITLIELLVALVIGGIIIAGIYRVFISQSKAYVIQDQAVETQQNVRSAMEFLLRDIRMAGYDGDNTPLTTYITPGANSVIIFYQHSGTSRQVTYSVDSNARLMRNQTPPDSSPEDPLGDPILTDVKELHFDYGIDTTDPPDGIVDSWTSTPGTSKIIAVQVRLTANPTNPQNNPDVKAVTPRTLQSRVTLRNLCLK